MTDLRGIHLQLSEGPAQGIAVHPELFSGFALIASVMGKYLKDIASLKLANRLRVRNSGTVHLNDETVQFALQRFTPRWVVSLRHFLIVNLRTRFDPIVCVVLEVGSTGLDKLLEVVRYNEGYRM